MRHTALGLIESESCGHSWRRFCTKLSFTYVSHIAVFKKVILLHYVLCKLLILHYFDREGWYALLPNA